MGTVVLPDESPWSEMAGQVSGLRFEKIVEKPVDFLN